jgi:competence protein CoiA
MKFALVDGIRTEAIKGYKGICPNCIHEVIPKCGLYKRHHWAHKGTQNCDPFWENETDWHRAWKDNYPDEWQEVSLPDIDSNCRHIADVRANDGLVIEFQHSHIDPGERKAREKFHKQMIWVVDGTRLLRDSQRFFNGKNHFQKVRKQVFQLYAPEKYFPKSWTNSAVPVIFDFKGLNIFDDNDERNLLYCLLPSLDKFEYTLIVFSRKYFIEDTTNGEWIKMIDRFLKISKNQQLPHNQIRQPLSLKKTTPYIFMKNGCFTI